MKSSIVKRIVSMTAVGLVGALCAQQGLAQFSAAVVKSGDKRAGQSKAKPSMKTAKSLQIQFNLSLRENTDKAGAMAFLKKTGLDAKDWLWTGANKLYYRGDADSSTAARVRQAVKKAAEAAPKGSKEARASVLMAEHVAGELNVKFKTRDKSKAKAALRKMGLADNIKENSLWSLGWMTLQKLPAGQEWKTVEKLMKSALVECAEYNGVMRAM